MTSWRWFIALGYLTATLAAQEAHHHGPTGHDVPRAQAACDAPGVHWAAHTDTPDLSHPAGDCSVCHVRASVPYVPEAGPPTPTRSAPSIVEADGAEAVPRPDLPISSRGPPRA
jgi:hypothetical protein